MSTPSPSPKGSLTLDQFINKHLGNKLDWDGFYSGQCMDLYRYYVHEVLGFPQSPGVGGASEIWDSASPRYYEFIENTIEGVPAKGDIVIWNRKVGGGFGHVAIFVSGDENWFTSFDQNYPTLNECTLTDHSYTNVIGWLHPKGTGMPDEGTQYVEGLGQVTFNKLIEEYGIEKGRVTSARAERDEALKNVESLEREVRTLRNENELHEVHLNSYLSALASIVGAEKDEDDIVKKIREIKSNSIIGATWQQLLNELVKRLFRGTRNA